jgi:hypothetical protein
MKNVLNHVICGYERSGTTLLNEIFRRHPKLDSGFEVGILLCNEPKEFMHLQPFKGMLCPGWRINSDELKDLCSVDNFVDFYVKLHKYSRIVVDKSVKLFDKTPAYMGMLPEVTKKVDCPIIVNFKDPEALFFSWTWRSKEAENIIISNYNRYVAKFKAYANSAIAAKRQNPNRIMINYYPRLISDPDYMLSKLFNFVGLTYKPEFKNFQSRYNVGTTITNKHLTKYKKFLSEDLIKRIREDTKQEFLSLIKWSQN